VQHIEMRQHMEGLKDEAHACRGAARQRVLIEPGVVDAVERQAPAVRPVQPGDQVEQRRFADAGFADDGDVLARLQAQRNALQDRATVELASEGFDVEHGYGKCGNSASSPYTPGSRWHKSGQRRRGNGRRGRLTPPPCPHDNRPLCGRESVTK
jgi:hypothetical protein